MHPELISSTFLVIGEILIAFTVIKVHQRFLKERRVDAKVFREMRKEQFVAALGIVFLIASFILKIFVRI